MRQFSSALLLLSIYCGQSYADVFSVTLTDEKTGNTYSDSFDDVENAFDAFDSDFIASVLPGFNQSLDTAVAQVNYRGLPMEFRYPDVGGSTLVLTVPELNIEVTFAGTSRDASLDELQNFLKTDGDEILNQIANRLAAVSPVDPVAGNPDSLMSQMAGQDFSIGGADNTSTSVASGAAASGTSAAMQDNQIGLGMRFGRYSVNDTDVTAISLPFSYTIRLDHDPRHQVHLFFPVDYIETGNDAKTYRLGAGIGYTYPIKDNWSITPNLSYGVVGSAELASAAAIRGTSITSHYEWAAMQGAFSLNNMIGYYQTESIKLEGVELNPELDNFIYKNGVSYERNLSKHWSATGFFTDTRYSGDQLYSERTNEIGLSFGSRNTGNRLVDNYANFGLTYLWADVKDFNGIRLNFGYSF